MPEEKQREFLQASSGQLEKLDFLMQAMIKTSRLETGVISLDRKIQPLYDTLAAALGGILLNAERKNIHVSVDCPTDISLAHDRKWTSGGIYHFKIADWCFYLMGYVENQFLQVGPLFRYVLLALPQNVISDNLCQTIDDMLNGAAPPQQMHEEENLFYKILSPPRRRG